MLWQLLTEIVNSILSSLIGKNLMEITRELNKKSLIYCSSIYIMDTWSVLAINNPILKFVYHL